VRAGLLVVEKAEKWVLMMVGQKAAWWECVKESCSVRLLYD
jgi:hypothetical protein